MNNRNYVRHAMMLIVLSLSVVSIKSFAGSVDELKYEISFLAKKLLDKSGKDTLTIKQAAFKKAFIGVCPEPTPQGIKLTCITPGHNAAKAGLQSGDLVVAIDDLSMVSTGSQKRKHHTAYHKVFDNLKMGEKLEFKVERHGKEMLIMVTVGEVVHPAYTMTISKDQPD